MGALYLPKSKVNTFDPSVMYQSVEQQSHSSVAAGQRYLWIECGMEWSEMDSSSGPEDHQEDDAI